MRMRLVFLVTFATLLVCCGVLAQENGDPCTIPGDCTSGFCVDGVCCNSECGGDDPNDCQVCSMAAGGTADGYCTWPAGGTNCAPEGSHISMGMCQGTTCSALICDECYSLFSGTCDNFSESGFHCTSTDPNASSAECDGAGTCVIMYCVEEYCPADNVCYQEHPTDPCMYCSQEDGSFRQTGIGGSCDDGLFCTTGETCDAVGQCNGGSFTCPSGWFCSEAKDECFDEEETPIDLVDFAAIAEDSLVFVTWETAMERDIVGYRLYRSTTFSGDYQQIIQSLIPAEGGQFSGASYDFTDGSVETGNTYYYKLESIDINGTSEFFGPVDVTLVEEPFSGCGVVEGGNFDFVLVLLVLGMAILGGKRMKKKAAPSYKRPEVKTTSSSDVVKKIGPAQTCSPSPTCPTAQ